MSLAPGTRLGAYEVVALLGAGGMGEVYRARDTRLKRDVALKILPESFATDRARLARFQREAEVLGSINHPLIAHVYGIEEGAGCQAIVMELVEGEDLAQRLGRGAIPIDEAIPIARQIAEALDAAHEQGIVHRDLKPANIKVRPDGMVKVLDFGLAKALDGAVAPRGAAGVSNSPTISSPAMTLQGMILGTAAYMSPEQAKGRPADRRSDLWAFGCVLYEMVTGTRPFDGEDVADTLALVLKGSPDWSALPADTPPSMRLLIQRCLDRDRRQRVASASTALFALSDASLGEERPTRASADAAAVRVAVDAAVTAARRKILRRGVLPLAVAASALGASAALLLTRPAPAAPTIARLEMDFPGSNLVGRGIMAISPDGQQVAYVSGLRLFVRSLADYGVREIAPTETAPKAQPVFSPDSRSIAFSAGGSLWRASPGGGAPIALCNVDQLFGASWHDSGIIVGLGSNGIVRCPADGGAVEQLVTVEAGQEAHGPQLLPDGKTLIYSLAQIADGRPRWDKAQIVAETIGGGGRRTLVSGGSDARFVATGHLLYALSGVVFAVPFDPSRTEITGQATPVVEGVMRPLTGLTGTTHFGTSANGTLIYLPGPVRTYTTERLLGTATREGAVTRLGVAPGPYEHVRASPDGTRLAVSSFDGTDGAVWIYPLDGSGPLQRLALQGKNTAAIWAPDGHRIAVQSNSANERAIFVVRDDGTGFERLTTPAAGEAHTPESWSPDGRYVSFSAERQGRYALRTVAVGTKTVAPVAGIESDEPINSTFSPDGKWIAYTLGVRGGRPTTTRGVYVQPFPPTGAVHQVPKQGLDFHPVWTRDGKQIIWVPSANSGVHAVVTMTASPGRGFSPPLTFPARVSARQASGAFRGFDVLPDGRIVGTLEPDLEAATAGASIHVVLNWLEELKQKARAR